MYAKTCTYKSRKAVVFREDDKKIWGKTAFHIYKNWKKKLDFHCYNLFRGVNSTLLYINNV